MRQSAFIALIALAGCVVPQDQKGDVYDITENTVTIRGAYDMTLDGTPAKPTAAMVAQAEAICPNARYLTAIPSNLHEYDYTFLYRFQCPTGPKRG